MSGRPNDTRKLVPGGLLMLYAMTPLLDHGLRAPLFVVPILVQARVERDR